MSLKADIAPGLAGATGFAMATAPSAITVPFYLSELWLSVSSILGVTVMIIVVINGVWTIFKGVRGWVRGKKK